jgi:imidazolonepropionase-like amidohydrolase
MTRMGNVFGYRAQFQKAVEYRRAWAKYDRDLAAWRKRHEPGAPAPKEGDPTKADDPPDPPARDFGLETLAAVLDGKILVHNHCYRADEMSLMLDLAKEFGFKIRSFHHSLEAYKIADRLAAEGVASSTWDDWWGFKLEAFDGIPENAAMLTRAGARAIIHSDSEREVRRLNLEAAKAMTAGRSAGIEVTEDQALEWVTANPAWALGLEARTGSLEKGKDADVVVWSGSPFSVYSLPQLVFIDGARVFDRKKGPRLSDFELGIADQEGER